MCRRGRLKLLLHAQTRLRGLNHGRVGKADVAWAVWLQLPTLGANIG